MLKTIPDCDYDQTRTSGFAFDSMRAGEVEPVDEYFHPAGTIGIPTNRRFVATGLVGFRADGRRKPQLINRARNMGKEIVASLKAD